jgi:hypothetical protein
MISAGVKGWESIEFKELLISAQEYLGTEDRVIQHKVTSQQTYLKELKQLILLIMSLMHYMIPELVNRIHGVALWRQSESRGFLNDIM